MREDLYGIQVKFFEISGCAESVRLLCEGRWGLTNQLFHCFNPSYYANSVTDFCACRRVIC